jgi:hypothetical protein
VADWTTISSLATAGGTFVLALATFASVRSANKAARATERTLMANIRPVLTPARPEDPVQKIGFGDDHWMKVEGGYAGVECTDSVIYMAIPLRNVGSGIAVLDRWFVHPARLMGESKGHRQPDEFKRLTRDLYVPPSDTGFWQGALRDPNDPLFAAVRDQVKARDAVTVDLLYGDHEGGQRTVSRFVLLPRDDDERWLAIVSRHWNIDRDDPR